MEEKKVMKQANPGPLGLLGFGLTTVLLSFYNAEIFSTLGVDTLAMGIFVGGIMQVIAGLLSYKKGETFAGTAFTMYGFFWLSFVATHTMQREFLFTTHTETHGLYLLMWGVVTAFMAIATIKHNKLSLIMFSSLAITFILLSLTPLTGINTFKIIGGILGIFTGLLAIYQAVAQVINEDFDKTVLPLP